ncbi:unnamed protein product [Ixodes persulcatus]
MLTFSKLTALRHLLGFQRTRAAFVALPLGRNYSTTTNPDDKSHMIVLTDDGSTIVCWHPEPEFPYEHTKPLPKVDPELNEGDSALKLQVRLDNINRSYRNERLEIEALTKLTYTTKHRWYPKNEKYKDPNPPVDREGL